MTEERKPKKMPKVKEKETPVKETAAAPEPKANDVRPAIAQGILSLMGRPQNLHEVVVKSLWDNRFRVNVWCHVAAEGKEITALYDPKLITDSFFVQVNPLGDIVQSSPDIKKKYGPNNPFARIGNGVKRETIADIMKP